MLCAPKRVSLNHLKWSSMMCLSIVSLLPTIRDGQLTPSLEYTRVKGVDTQTMQCTVMDGVVEKHILDTQF